MRGHLGIHTGISSACLVGCNGEGDQHHKEVCSYHHNFAINRVPPPRFNVLMNAYERTKCSGFVVAMRPIPQAARLKHSNILE